MKSIFSLMTCLCLLGCASYQQKISGPYGFTDALLADGLYFVEYTQPHNWSKSDAKKFWHQRAAELCRSKNYTVLKYYEYVDYLTPQSGVHLIGNIPVAYNDSVTTAVSEGYIKCANSSIDEETTNRLLSTDRRCYTCISKQYSED